MTPGTNKNKSDSDVSADICQFWIEFLEILEF